VDVTAGERVCEECTTRLEPWEGRPAPRLYGFTAKQVANADFRAGVLTPIRELWE